MPRRSKRKANGNVTYEEGAEGEKEPSKRVKEEEQEVDEQEVEVEEEEAEEEEQGSKDFGSTSRSKQANGVNGGDKSHATNGTYKQEEAVEEEVVRERSGRELRRGNKKDHKDEGENEDQEENIRHNNSRSGVETGQRGRSKLDDLDRGEPEEAEEPEGDEPQDEGDEPQDEGEEEEGEEITRCVCGQAELDTQNIKSRSFDTGLFIQCDECQVWQHGFCVGFLDEAQVPEVYYCEKCRPEFHTIVNRPWGRNSMYNPDKKDEGKRKRKDKRKANEEAGEVHRGGRKGESHVHPQDHSQNHQNQSQNQYQNPQNPQNQHNQTQLQTAGQNATGPVSNNRQSNKTQQEMSAEETRSRRRTLNSRDAEYEETLKRVLEESARGQDGTGNTNNNIINNNMEQVDGRVEDSEMESSSTGNRRASRRKTTTTTTTEDSPHSEGKTRQSQSHNGNKASMNGTLNGVMSEQPDKDMSSDERGSSARTTKKRRHATRLSATSITGEPGTVNGSASASGSGSGVDDSNIEHISPSDDGRRRGGGRNSKRALEDETGGSDGVTKGRSKRKKKGTGADSSGGGANGMASNGGGAGGRSKPRIPSARSTLVEMQKRVAAICEFLSRTEVDLDLEEQDRRRLVGACTSRREVLGLPGDDRFATLFEMHPTHLTQMKALSDKLSEWEAKFGKFGEEQ